jgi:hypothetical protein
VVIYHNKLIYNYTTVIFTITQIIYMLQTSLSYRTTEKLPRLYMDIKTAKQLANQPLNQFGQPTNFPDRAADSVSACVWPPVLHCPQLPSVGEEMRLITFYNFRTRERCSTVCLHIFVVIFSCNSSSLISDMQTHKTSTTIVC